LFLMLLIVLCFAFIFFWCFLLLWCSLNVLCFSCMSLWFCV
jgi:hypothetical protein